MNHNEQYFHKLANSRYAKQTTHNGIKMTLVGYWQDLAAYYKGSDGNYWSYQSGFASCGPRIRNKRGITMAGEAITSVADLRTPEEIEREELEWA